MSLPKQVVQQQQELAELEKALVSDPANPQNEQDSTAEPQPVATPEQTAQASASEPAVQAPEVGDHAWEQRYKSLKGHFDAEVPRLHSQVKELTRQVEQMTSQVQAPVPPAPAATPDKPLVTDQDRESFGTDLIDVMERVTRQVMREHVAPLQQELAKRDEKIAAMAQQLANTSTDISTLTFEQRLARTIPDFEQINSDPKWIAWLDEVDALTGEPRRTFANYVYQQGNTEKVKQVVDLFRQTLKPGVAQQQRQTELERQVQPPRTNPSTSTSTQPRIYTDAEMTRLESKIRRLYSDGKVEEAAPLERELNAAYLENRVRG